IMVSAIGYDGIVEQRSINDPDLFLCCTCGEHSFAEYYHTCITCGQPRCFNCGGEDRNGERISLEDGSLCRNALKYGNDADAEDDSSDSGGNNNSFDEESESGNSSGDEDKNARSRRNDSEGDTDRAEEGEE